MSTKLWISTSPNSELIVVVNVSKPAPGFKNTLLNVAVCELPEVTLLPSGIDCAIILIPGLLFEMVKEPKFKPVFISIDCTIALFVEITELTINTVL